GDPFVEQPADFGLHLLAHAPEPDQLANRLEVEPELPRSMHEDERADGLLIETAIPALTALRGADDACRPVAPDRTRGQAGTAGCFADVHQGSGHGGGGVSDRIWTAWKTTIECTQASQSSPLPRPATAAPGGTIRTRER